MRSKNLMYLSILFFVVACKAQFPFEEYEEEDDEDEDPEPAPVTIKPAEIVNGSTVATPRNGTIGSNSNSTTRQVVVSASAKQNKPKQEEVEDETEAPATTVRGPSFGPQVASIIKGALSGNLGSILTGSFNLVPNTQSRENVNKAWESIAGITSTTLPTTKKPVTSTVASTTAAEAEEDDDEEEGRIVI